ncbi:MAG: DUF1573 domain-containing protein [Acidobacteria bacterium]|nr:DUF1573 domain-containing protein [Acidobacteriota bacterium]
MKLVRVLVLVVIPFVLLSAAVTATPDITFEKKEIDFGTVQAGDVMEYTFKFKNTGDQDLILKKVTATCGCTAVQSNKNAIKPGETGEITAKLHTGGYRQRMVKYIYVETNVPHMPRITLIMSANPISDVDVKPNSYIGFWNLKQGETSTRELEILNNTKDPLELQKPEIGGANPDLFKFDVSTLEPGKLYKLKVTFSSENSGRFNAKLKIKTNKTNKPEIEIPLSAAVLDDVYLLPNALIIKRKNEQEPRFKTVKVMNSTDKKLEIKGVELDTKWLEYKIEPIGKSDNYRMTVFLKDNAPKEVIRGTIKIKTNNEKFPELSVRYYIGEEGGN